MENIEASAKMLISAFNMFTGMKYRGSNEGTRNLVKKCIEESDGNVSEVKKFFKDFAETGSTSIVSACEAYIAAKKQVKVDEPVIPEAQEKTATGALDVLSQVVVEMLAKTKASEIEEAVGKRMEKRLEQFIFDTYGPITRRVEIKVDDRKIQFDGVVHQKFDDVIKYVKRDKPVFLTGPAGSGKNVLCQQVAKAMGLDFYFSNAITQEYKITGYSDAMGVFHESQFYKAFKNGGLFMLDEMDASIPEVLLILNAAIANRYFDFPAPIGFVKAHENSRVIAAGNTFGIGADYDYVGRNQLDAASLDRFKMVRIDYDPRIEEALALGNNDLLRFCRKFRQVTKKAGIRTVVSYRAIKDMAELDDIIDAKDLIDSCLVKSLDVGDLDAIRKDMTGCGKYSEAFSKLVEERKAA